MRDHPETRLLLESARRTLMEQIAPLLEGDSRATILMVARAMAVAIKRIETDARNFSNIDQGRSLDELAELAALLGTEPKEALKVHGSTRTAIHRLERDLCAAIRLGDFDAVDEKQQALHRFLLSIARQKISESNPKMLEQMEQEGKRS